MPLNSLHLDEKWPGTPVPHLLKTNSVPSEADRLTILQVLEDYEKEIKALRQEVPQGRDRLSELANRISELRGNPLISQDGDGDVPEALEQIISDLESDASDIMLPMYTIIEQASNLKEMKRKHQAALSVIRRLPPELLAEIFFLARPTQAFHQDSSTNFVGDPIPHNIGYNFSQACANWRQAALGSAAIWASIPAVDEEYDGDRVCGYHHLICAFLERSKGHPIDVVISITFTNEHYHNLDAIQRHGKAFPLILPILFGTTNRWRTAVIFLLKEIFCNLRRSEFPILQRLNLRSCKSNFWPFPRRFFGKTPMLKHVFSDGRYFVEHQSNRSDKDLAPLALLTNIESFTGLPRSSIDLALCLGTLTECTFRGPLSKVVLHPKNKQNFPQLRYLCVTNTTYHRMASEQEHCTIFQCIEAPALKTLIVRGHPNITEPPSTISDIVNHTLSTAPLLTRLVLHISGITKTDLICLLRVSVTPHLTELDVYQPCIVGPRAHWNEFVVQPTPELDASDVRSREAHLLRKLTSLVVRNGKHVDLTTLYMVYKSRRHSESAAGNDLSISAIFDDYSSLLRSLSFAEDHESDLSNCLWLEPRSGSEQSKIHGWTTFLMKQFIARLNPESHSLKIRGRRIKPHCRPNLSQTPETSEQLDRVFETLETHDFQDPRLLEVTGILQAMEHIARLPANPAWKNKKLDFIARAHVVAEKWNNLLRGHKARLAVRWTILDDGLTLVAE